MNDAEGATLADVLHIGAEWVPGAPIERAVRVVARVTFRQRAAAHRALRGQRDATEDIRADPVVQLVDEPRWPCLIDYEEHLFLAAGHGHVEQAALLRVRIAFHLGQQQPQQRLLGNGAGEALQPAGAA